MNISSSYSSNSEASASELLENLEEMFPLYYTISVGTNRLLGSEAFSSDNVYTIN